jgi:hypothetical protein
MKYTVEMGSDAMTYIPNLVKISPDIQKFIRGTHKHTDTMVTA